MADRVRTIRNTHEQIVDEYIEAISELAKAGKGRGYAPMTSYAGPPSTLPRDEFTAAISQLYELLTGARIFEFRDHDYATIFKAAEVYLSESIAGFEYEEDRERFMRHPTEPELEQYHNAVIPQTTAVPLPEHLPFENCYLAWGEGEPLPPVYFEALTGAMKGESGTDETGERRLLVATLVTARGYVFSRLVVKREEPEHIRGIYRELEKILEPLDPAARARAIRGAIAQFPEEQLESRLGSALRGHSGPIPDAFKAELFGKENRDKLAEEVILYDHTVASRKAGLSAHMYISERLWVVERTPERGWLNPYYPTPWVITTAIDAINSCGTLVPERQSLGTKAKLKRIVKEARRPQPAPQPYYRVYVEAQTIEAKFPPVPPKPKDWSHRWDVRGTDVWRIMRGPLPIDPKLYHRLTKRKYRIFTELNRPDGETCAFLMKRHLPPLRAGEWLAAQKVWRHEHVKGPEGKPYIPSAHKLRRRIPETIAV